MESQGRVVPHSDLHATLFPPPSLWDHTVTGAGSEESQEDPKL